MKNRTKTGLRFLVALVLLLTLCIWKGTSVKAAASGYTTDAFTVRMQVTNDHIVHVTEEISVDFTKKKHGIFRYIPFRTDLYQIRNIEVPEQKVKVDTETKTDHMFFGVGRGYKEIRIGRKNRLVYGPQRYTISYDLVCFRDDDPGADFLALDLFPSNWETAVKQVRFVLELPKAVDPAAFRFYAGASGSTDQSEIRPEISADGKVITYTGENIPASYGVTVQANLPQGYWESPANRDFAKPLAGGMLILVPLLGILLWLTAGRDQKPVMPVEFYPPEGMTPAELGYVIDGHIDQGDMTSMLLYFASKGYLRVHEYEKNQFELICTGKEIKDEKAFARILLNGIFKGYKEGATVRLDKMPKKFGEAVISSEAALKDYYIYSKKKLYSGKSRFFRVLMSLLGILYLPLVALTGNYYRFYSTYLAAFGGIAGALIGLLILCYAYDRSKSLAKGKYIRLLLIGGILYFVQAALASLYVAALFDSHLFGILAAAGACINLAVILPMKSRTGYASELYGRILGFRNFIRLAEYDRLRMLSEENPSYFFDIMPYAYVMGMSTKWAEKFMNLQIEAPEWYSSYDGRFYFTPLWYSSFASSSAGQFSSGFSNLSDAGSHGSFGGGFSGGGFSGGGFGGGGGGAW